MSGIVKRLEGEEADKAKQAYLAKKPDALFLNFGDFGIYRMEEVKSIFYAVNIGIGGGESGEVCKALSCLYTTPVHSVNQESN